MESEGEGQPKPPRRKPKRVRKDGSLAEAMEDTIRDADLTVEPVPLPKTSPEILMVEVDNVQHEEFQITEEVKVLAVSQDDHVYKQWLYDMSGKRT